LSGREIPVVLPAEAQLILRGLDCDLIDDDDVEPAWLETLADDPRPGPVRPAVRALSAEGRVAHDMA
jgi:acetoin utilization protein AcuC